MNEIEIALGDNEVDENSYFGNLYRLVNKVLLEYFLEPFIQGLQESMKE